VEKQKLPTHFMTGLIPKYRRSAIIRNPPVAVEKPASSARRGCPKQAKFAVAVLQIFSSIIQHLRGQNHGWLAHHNRGF
jgi:hypothetical protein